jgi:hypothetical protein
MKAKLQDGDRRALDLLLDRSPTAATGKSGSVYVAAATGVRERIPHVQKVLQLLDALPAMDPPKDLVARTLEFIDNPTSQRRAARAARDLSPALAEQPPVA